ncbi:hypothetical protein [Phytomonospora endophytica]|uniref:Uncharacterized protein n=1 Tax=Phytomonospora endophytica TaxID=714109 RepID=A0A841FFC1_9ACTN|nr:hypothetical protein [Phytomonospora endophytica]MBB6034534.1 hypothetical protein [Phytomonospora endophytica]GIG70442.1 hypothetical protein Pen01_67370 [Phytomonospora endophytica]
MPTDGAFAVDLLDLKAYARQLKLTSEADASRVFGYLGDLAWNSAGGGDGGGAEHVLGMHGHITSVWAADHDRLLGEMRKTLNAAETRLRDYSLALKEIAEAYADADEDNRRKVDDVYAEGQDDNDNAQRNAPEQSSRPFEHRSGDYDEAYAGIYHSDPRIPLDGLLTAMGSGGPFADAKNWLKSCGIDLDDHILAYQGPWEGLANAVAAGELFRAATAAVADNTGRGMDDVQVTWDGSAAELARIHIGNFEVSVENEGYPEFGRLNTDSLAALDDIAFCAAMTAFQFKAGLAAIVAGNELVPFITVVTSIPGVERPLGQPPDGTALYNAVKGALAASALWDRIRGPAALGLLWNGLELLVMGCLSVKRAVDRYTDGVQPAIKLCLESLSDRDFPPLLWTN